MAVLIIGLVLFLGLHSTRIVADGARTRFIERHGAGRWRGLYSLVSALGLVLIVWGYSLTLREPVVVYGPAPWSRTGAGLLTLAAIVLIAAAYVPRNHFKAWVGHPMVLGTALWALAHLQTSSTAADVLLFGGFLLWAVVCFVSLRARDRKANVQRAPGRPMGTLLTVGVGVVAWALFAFWLHAPLIGIAPYP